MKTVAVLTFPPGVNTLILPVVAPAGTVTLILVAVSLVIGIATAPMVTLVAPARWVPMMVTVVPTGPEEGLTLVIVGGATTVSVKFWVAGVPMPLVAVRVVE